MVSTSTTSSAPIISGDLEDKLGGSLEDGSGIGLIDPNDPIKDKKEFIFDVSGFMPMLSPFGLQQHYFTIKLIDNNGIGVSQEIDSKSGEKLI